MKSTHTFDYSMGEQVLIIALERPAYVNGLRVTCDGMEYFCSWWNEAERESQWLPGYELQEKK